MAKYGKKAQDKVEKTMQERGKVPAPKKKTAKKAVKKAAKKKTSVKKKIITASLILGSLVTVAGSLVLANRMQLLRLPFRLV